MGATSVTGTGPGESFGEYKPENSSGCCPSGPAQEASTPTRIRRQCAAKVRTGGSVIYKSGGSGKIRVC